MSVMNLTENAVVNICEDKCSLSFNYPNSPSCVITNSGNLFNISYQLENSYSPVTFNNSQFYFHSNVIYLALPSIHEYNGSDTTAELFFCLTDNTNQTLCISIPINSNAKNSSPLLTNILSDIVDYQINESGESKTININDFTLNDIIPYKPYYYYENDNTNVIAYGIENALYISESTLSTLSSYITNIPDSVKAIIFPYTSTLLKNIKGPSISKSGEIYIDCQPVNSSKETSIQMFKKQSGETDDGKSNVNFFQLLNAIGFDQTTVIILISMSIILLLYILPTLSGSVMNSYQYITKSNKPNVNANISNIINDIPVFQIEKKSII